jgi:hypothetical protein
MTHANQRRINYYAPAVEDAAAHMPMLGRAPLSANRNAAAQVVRALLEAGWDLRPPEMDRADRKTRDCVCAAALVPGHRHEPGCRYYASDEKDERDGG